VPDVRGHLQASAQMTFKQLFPLGLLPGSMHRTVIPSGRLPTLYGKAGTEPDDVVAETAGHLAAKKRLNAACASVEANRSVK